MNPSTPSLPVYCLSALLRLSAALCSRVGVRPLHAQLARVVRGEIRQGFVVEAEAWGAILLLLDLAKSFIPNAMAHMQEACSALARITISRAGVFYRLV
jgi:hypothetical protein